jgi:hypothetical protein
MPLLTELGDRSGWTNYKDAAPTAFKFMEPTPGHEPAEGAKVE